MHAACQRHPSKKKARVAFIVRPARDLVESASASVLVGREFDSKKKEKTFIIARKDNVSCLQTMLKIFQRLCN